MTKRFNPVSLRNLDQTTHGLSGTPTYRSWQMMRRRASGFNPRWYSGVTVCDRWQSFENFLADMGVRPAGKTIDRIDNSKGYEPGNCRWATASEQQSNKRSNVILELNGKRQCVDHWAKELGIPKARIHKRIDLGWPTERILSNKLFHENKGRRKQGATA